MLQESGVFQTFSVLSPFSWFSLSMSGIFRLHVSFATKEVCNRGVACSLLKLECLEKTVIASLFHSGLHSGTIFLWKNEAISYIGRLKGYDIISTKFVHL